MIVLLVLPLLAAGKLLSNQRRRVLGHPSRAENEGFEHAHEPEQCEGKRRDDSDPTRIEVRHAFKTPDVHVIPGQTIRLRALKIWRRIVSQPTHPKRAKRAASCPDLGTF